MKFYLISSMLLICSIMTAQSGQKEVSVIFSHKVNGQALVLGETTFPIWNGKMVKLKRAEFYLSGLSVLDEAGNTTSFPDAYLLVRAHESGRNITIGSVGEIPVKQLSMHIGVDSIKNHEDPTLYPETHPLGLKDPSMHWGWAGGYRFMAIEGMVDNSGDGVPETEFEFHNLGDALYVEALIAISQAHHTENGIVLPIELDYAKLFDQLTMTGSLFVHGSAAKNITMMNNAVNKGFFQLISPVSGTDENVENDWNLIQDSDHIGIKSTSAHSGMVSLVDASGKQLLKTALHNGEARFNTSHLISGLYIVAVETQKGISSKTVWVRK